MVSVCKARQARLLENVKQTYFCIFVKMTKNEKQKIKLTKQISSQLNVELNSSLRQKLGTCKSSYRIYETMTLMNSIKFVKKLMHLLIILHIFRIRCQPVCHGSPSRKVPNHFTSKTPLQINSQKYFGRNFSKIQFG